MAISPTDATAWASYRRRNRPMGGNHEHNTARGVAASWLAGAITRIPVSRLAGASAAS